MALVFAWRPEGPNPEEARQRFEDELNTLASKASQAAKRDDFAVRTIALDSLLAGIVDTDYGIEGHHPWCESDTAVVLFSGVCENYLGEDPARVADDMLRLTRDDPGGLADLDGRFSTVVVDKAANRAFTATGAFDVSTLWMTDGAEGWAVGSRVAPLLRLVRRELELDGIGAGLLLSFGYLWGDESLYNGVARVPARTVVCPDRPGGPDPAPYLALSSFVSDCPALGLEESVAAFAGRLKARVRRQRQYSPNPLISLSAGVDSRSIAAALHGTGEGITAYTSGPRTSREVRLAAEVAGALGMPVVTPGRTMEDVLSQACSIEQCIRWSELSEGVESIHHLLSVPDLFLEGKPILGDTVHHVFHGHGGNMYHGPYYRRLYPDRKQLERTGSAAQLFEMFRRAIPAQLRNRDAVEARLESGIMEFAEELAGLDLPLTRWFDLFYRDKRCLLWGNDMFAAKDLLGWHWSPLMDRELLRASLRVRCSPWDKLRFMEQVVEALAPEAAEYPYLGAVLTRSRRWSKQLRRLVPPLARPWAGRVAERLLGASTSPTGPGLGRFWEEVFSTADVLDTLMPRSHLDHLRQTAPTSRLLWNAATLALAARRWR